MLSRNLQSSLDGNKLIQIWELGLGQHRIDRALTMLAVAYPEMPPDTFARLSLAERDALLLAVRERVFGTRLAGFTECPACQKRLEFAANTTELRTPYRVEGEKDGMQVSEAGYEVTFRAPNSLDLAAILQSGEPSQARRHLIQRCILGISQAGIPRRFDDLPAPVAAVIELRVVEANSQTQIELDLTCPECSHQWSTLFDIAAFLWAEVSAQARRLLREVDVLARAYGWREDDILSLSPARRDYYLKVVG